MNTRINSPSTSRKVDPHTTNQFLSQSIITDLERYIAAIRPATTDQEIQYRAMCKRLEDHWGPNPKKTPRKSDASSTTFKGTTTEVGIYIYLSNLDELTEVLAKTPVRDTANNSIMEPVVAVRPHLPHRTPLHTPHTHKCKRSSPPTAPHKSPGTSPIRMNHRPTYPAIKNIVILALG